LCKCHLKNLGFVPILSAMHVLLQAIEYAALAVGLLVGGTLVLAVACYAMLAVYYVAISPFLGAYWLIRQALRARANRAVSP
jgi:hypothetical protein